MTVTKRNFANGLREKVDTSEGKSSVRKGKKKKKTFKMGDKTFVDESAPASSVQASTLKSSQTN